MSTKVGTVLFEYRSYNSHTKQALYQASHEIWNTVDILLPDGYFGEGKPWPELINVPDFTVLPIWEPPTEQVRDEMKRRMPNLQWAIEHGGYLSVGVPETDMYLWCGGDTCADGWRFQVESVADGTLDVAMPPIIVDGAEQDVNRICTALMDALRKSAYSHLLFGYCAT